MDTCEETRDERWVVTLIFCLWRRPISCPGLYKSFVTHNLSVVLTTTFIHSAVHLHNRLIPFPLAYFFSPTTPITIWQRSWVQLRLHSFPSVNFPGIEILLRLCDRTKTATSHQITRNETRSFRKSRGYKNIRPIFSFYCMLWPIHPDTTMFSTSLHTSSVWCILWCGTRIIRGRQSMSPKTNTININTINCALFCNSLI